ncbi:amino acid adenylation domain-containing protein [Streptomyces alkaliterrae]|uniref:Amino acid adenylation domain-containing protein n=1 Tax=Streptomyces alkaliterrae TaxID=2213162 RepID=A0A5P0YM02_9ACTN|nr:amino acid adenylation domain-containing protein [Streptomyces alkaliterrae]MBB1257766.1 amino acid adenylation domain-containing protein [Streptomyces alkaliterrae]MQS01268.1 amino acid adenylation domain-containing protein [Streptomyces alkaliterrae]
MTVDGGNAPPGPADHPGTLDAWFARQAAGRGDAVAVTGPDGRLTYRELDRRANRLAHRLRSLGVGPEVPVAVRAARTTGLVTALLAVLKAGGAYLPMDPASPRERQEFMCADAGARVLVTDSATDPLAPVAHTVVTGLADDLDDLPADSPPPAGTRPANLAYVIYTSGSTGVPKGVMVEHRQVTALLTGVRDRFGFGPDDVWSMFAPAAFDVSVWEMWGALLHGGRLVLVPDDVRRSPQDFHALLARERVTVLNQTPAAFRQLVRHEEETAERGDAPARLDLRLVVFAGEALPPQTLRPWIDRHGDARPVLVNMYGITETTVHSTYRRMTEADLAPGVGSVIGEAIGGWTMRVLDARGRAAAAGTPGEIHVGGAGVARGYLGRPALTAERFVPDPDSPVPGARRYRSGDSARRTGDGDHEYLGRLDHQVKIRGHRIEPGEIENALTRHPDVRDAVVVTDRDAAGEPRLVAYWVAAPGGAPPGPTELRDHLGRGLPQYMVPAVFVALDSLPLTLNGKVDRRALPAPEAQRPDLDAEFAEPNTPTQKALADVWADLLSVDRVGLDDDFFELGGHSMLATRAAAVAGERLGVRVTLRMLFDRPTVRELAEALDATSAPRHDNSDRGDA